MSECPIVETSLGKVKGTVVNNLDQGRDVFRYSSLPFAKPPVGQLRFEPPVEPDPWSGVIDGTNHSASPHQDRIIAEGLIKFMPNPKSLEKMSEDCLYLTVYTSTTAKTANFPVLLWIYGGGFVIGSEILYDASVLTALHDVVVVIPNYRVSIFGFLSLGRDSDITGNYGLMDQLMAMKWTQKHIKNFGGNPDNITIFGESAGAVSVNYHVVLPQSRGYFHKAISHSGSIYMNLINEKTNDYSLSLLLKQLKIEEEDQKELAMKLKFLPAEEIMDALKVLREKIIFFTPVVDGSFIPHDLERLSQDKVNPVPYIVGINNSEGNGILSNFSISDFMRGISKEVLMAALKGYLGPNFYKGLPDSAFDLIVEEYAKGIPDDKMKWSNIYGNISGDIVFVNPAIRCCKQHFENNCSTFMYVMTQTTKFNHDPMYGPEQARKPEFCECDHGDDLLYTFGFPFYNKKLSFDVKFTEEEKKLSGEWMKYIVNFAKNSNPNIGQSLQVKWPEYDTKEQIYLSVQQPCSIGKNFSLDRYKFWTEVIAPMRNTS